MRPLFAPLLMIGGIALAVLGFVLWRVMPIPSSGPPFVLTPLLAVGLGAFDWWWTKTLSSGDKRP